MEAVRHKRGDVREDGKVFWQYHKRMKGGEWWLTPARFAEKTISNRDYKVAHRAANLETLRSRRVSNYAANREAEREQQRRHYADNRDAILAKAVVNRDSISAAEKERYKRDPLFALRKRARCLIYNAFRSGGYTKESKTAEIVGCSWDALYAHIENQFTDGMCWERFSEIHIDHIVPLASAKSKDEIISLNHYLNLQPLWASDNLRKGCKMPE